MRTAQEGKRPDVPLPVIQRYIADKCSKHKMFALLKEFVSDTSCAAVTVEECHVQASRSFASTEYDWKCRFDLMTEYDAFKNPEAKDHVDWLIIHAKRHK